MSNNLFTPGPGFAQSAYFDQMATAIFGQIANASDQVLIDSLTVSPEVGPFGLLAGLGVIAVPIPAAEREGYRDGLNTYYVDLPQNADTPVESFAGISVRNQQMDSNAEGDACWFSGRMANVMRASRVGGRIWARLTQGAAEIDGDVFWVTEQASDTSPMLGSFVGADISGGGLGTSVLIPSAKFKSNAQADGSPGGVLVLIELNLAY